MKREFDGEGLRLASYQARLCEASLRQGKESSPIFLRRLMKSDYIRRLDELGSAFSALEEEEGFRALREQYGESQYGKIRFSPEELHWIGWIYRYIAYTRDAPSSMVYAKIKPDYLRQVYRVFHTQDEEWAVARIFSALGLSDEDFDKNAIFKKGLRERFQA